MRNFIYISGPPCAGKSSVTNKLNERNINYKMILGDNFWIKHSLLDFKNRVEVTNREILSSVEEIKDSTLLEWVPSYGSFVEELKRIVKSKSFNFVHILVYAPVEILKERKYIRDGDMDLGPIDLDAYIALEDVHLFDSSKMTITEIARACYKLINE